MTDVHMIIPQAWPGTLLSCTRLPTFADILSHRKGEEHLGVCPDFKVHKLQLCRCWAWRKEVLGSSQPGESEPGLGPRPPPLGKALAAPPPTPSSSVSIACFHAGAHPRTVGAGPRGFRASQHRGESFSPDLKLNHRPQRCGCPPPVPLGCTRPLWARASQAPGEGASRFLCSSGWGQLGGAPGTSVPTLSLT